jgi:hypothetical protein
MTKVIPLRRKSIFAKQVKCAAVKRAVAHLTANGKYPDILPKLEAALRLQKDGYCELGLTERAIVSMF